MKTNQLIGGLAIYQLVSARLRHRGVWWFLFVFAVMIVVATYYAMSRLFVVWPYRLYRSMDSCSRGAES
jgi:hypothetical protein